jgi:isobutyryl-CoA mutase
MYQRGKIQEESLHYETRKHDGSLPIVGVNTFLNENVSDEHGAAPLFRASEEEQAQQVSAVKEFQQRHADESGEALRRLQQIAASGGNVFAELLETVQVCSLGQITRALYEVGGQYRRHM